MTRGNKEVEDLGGLEIIQIKCKHFASEHVLLSMC